MGYTITCINNSTSLVINVIYYFFCEVAFIFFSFAHLREKSERSLHTNEQTLYIKCFEHDFCHLLTIFGGVEGRFSQDKSVLLWFAFEVVVDGSVPVFFDSFPVTYLTGLQDILEVVRLLVIIGLISNIEIHVRISECGVGHGLCFLKSFSDEVVDTFCCAVAIQEGIM